MVARDRGELRKERKEGKRERERERWRGVRVEHGGRGNYTAVIKVVAFRERPLRKV